MVMDHYKLKILDQIYQKFKEHTLVATLSKTNVTAKVKRKQRVNTLQY